MTKMPKPWLYNSTDELQALLGTGKPELARIVLHGLRLHYEDDTLAMDLLTGNFLLHFLSPNLTVSSEVPPEECVDWRNTLNDQAAELVMDIVSRDPHKWLPVIDHVIVKAVLDFYGTEIGGLALRRHWQGNGRQLLRHLWDKNRKLLNDSYALVCYRARDWQELIGDRLWGAAPIVFSELKAKRILRHHHTSTPMEWFRLRDVVLKVLARNEAYHECMYLLQALMNPDGSRFLLKSGIIC